MDVSTLNSLNTLSQQRQRSIYTSYTGLEHKFRTKPVECICLLPLNFSEFPVDKNVSRIVVTLLWVLQIATNCLNQSTVFINICGLLSLLWIYRRKNTKQTAPLTNIFLNNHLHKETQIIEVVISHMTTKTIKLQYGNIEDFGPYKDIEELRHNKTTNTI